MQQERNIVDVEDAREVQYREGAVSGAPVFLTNVCYAVFALEFKFCVFHRVYGTVYVSY